MRTGMLAFTLLCLLTVGAVQGLQVNSRELGIADIPPCGVSTPTPNGVVYAY